jgi:hypothetical protein
MIGFKNKKKEATLWEQGAYYSQMHKEKIFALLR